MNQNIGVKIFMVSAAMLLAYFGIPSANALVSLLVGIIALMILEYKRENKKSSPMGALFMHER